MPKTQACTFCGVDLTSAELDNPEVVYIEVNSWVHGKKLQSPVLRERTGRKAHSACVKKIIDGEAADQKPLPGLEA